MLSDPRIREISKEFICLKVDPRSPGAGKAAMKFKSTRYVPEVVFLSPEGEVLDRLDDRSPEGVLATMKSVLEEVKKARER